MVIQSGKMTLGTPKLVDTSSHVFVRIPVSFSNTTDLTNVRAYLERISPPNRNLSLPKELFFDHSTVPQRRVANALTGYVDLCEADVVGRAIRVKGGASVSDLITPPADSDVKLTIAVLADDHEAVRSMYSIQHLVSGKVSVSTVATGVPKSDWTFTAEPGSPNSVGIVGAQRCAISYRNYKLSKETPWTMRLVFWFPTASASDAFTFSAGDIVISKSASPATTLTVTVNGTVSGSVSNQWVAPGGWTDPKGYDLLISWDPNSLGSNPLKIYNRGTASNTQNYLNNTLVGNFANDGITLGDIANVEGIHLGEFDFFDHLLLSESNSIAALNTRVTPIPITKLLASAGAFTVV